VASQNSAMHRILRGGCGGGGLLCFFVTILMAAAAPIAFELWFQKLLYVYNGWLYDRDFAQTLSDVLNTIAITGIVIVGPAILLFRSELRSVLALASDSANIQGYFLFADTCPTLLELSLALRVKRRAGREKIARDS
jgi:hypothetical protein